MAYFVGLDVSVKETSVCIVDDTGKIVREARVASRPIREADMDDRLIQLRHRPDHIPHGSEIG
jgi:predicted NBD/HSP70 family sugar kinase